jgi:hypothetical protein
MGKNILTIFFLTFLALPVFGQSYAFGIKGGMTVGFQQWDNSFQRDPLYRYHAIGFIESADEDEKFSLFAQAGYHVKGSAIRTRRTVIIDPITNQPRPIPAQERPFEFRNISLTLGGKQKFNASAGTKYYYLVGIRGDYTLSTQLRPDFVEENDPYAVLYPFEEFVQDWNYGLTAGGGFEIQISEFVSTMIELTINPDFSRQYLQPEIPNVPAPFEGSPNSLITIQERQIVNTTVELTLGFRFLHKIEYLDEY